MSIMWIKNQAKWIIILATLLIAAGLLFMDRPGASRQGYGMHGDFVGSVDGEQITTPVFQQELKNYIRSEEARTGKAPEGMQLVQMREGLFQFKVQGILIQKAFAHYQLYASVPEMQEYLLKHPLDVGYSLARYEGVDHVPVFLRDSTLDTLRFRNWLTQDSVYDRLGMRAMEEQMRTSIIPQIQLQELLQSQVHRTDLEEKFAAEMRESKGRIRFYAVPADSFPIAKDKFSEADLKGYFEANPDSFYYHDEAARLHYVRIPIRPSAKDTALMRDFAKELKERVEKGETFADLAKSYSNDPGSADSGGRLGGYLPRSSWVPAFADAAFKLDSGAISDPVLTQYGYHVILSDGKKTENGVEKAKVRHILLKISAGTETLDSLTDIADQIQNEAEKDGLESTAKAHHLTVEQTPIFEKGNSLPLTTTYLQGVQSFAFSPHEQKAKVSEVLQNDEGVYVFERDQHYPKGRNFERAKEDIAKSLVQSKKREAAQQELERLKTQIAAQAESPAPKIGKATLDSTALIAPDSYVPEFGYGSPQLVSAFRQKEGIWGPVLNTANSSVLAQLLQFQPAEESVLESKVRETMQMGDGQLINEMYQQWLANLPKTAKVENHLDAVYRD